MGRISSVLDALEQYLRTHAEAAMAVHESHRLGHIRTKQLMKLDEQAQRLNEEGLEVSREMQTQVGVMIDHMKGIGPWMARIEQKLDCVTGPTPSERAGSDE